MNFEAVTWLCLNDLGFYRSFNSRNWFIYDRNPCHERVNSFCSNFRSFNPYVPVFDSKCCRIQENIEKGALTQNGLKWILLSFAARWCTCVYQRIRNVSFSESVSYALNEWSLWSVEFLIHHKPKARHHRSFKLSSKLKNLS